MSTLSQFRPAIKSQQTGYTTIGSLPSSGSGIDNRYYDITLGTEVNDTKCVIDVRGYSTNEGNYNPGLLAARLTSTTNLRLSSGGSTNSGAYGCRWTVTEFF